MFIAERPLSLESRRSEFLTRMIEIVSGARPERFELPTPWFVEKCPIPSLFLELKELS